MKNEVTYYEKGGKFGCRWVPGDSLHEGGYVEDVDDDDNVSNRAEWDAVQKNGEWKITGHRCKLTDDQILAIRAELHRSSARIPEGK